MGSDVVYQYVLWLKANLISTNRAQGLFADVAELPACRRTWHVQGAKYDILGLQKFNVYVTETCHSPVNTDSEPRLSLDNVLQGDV